MRDKSEAWLGLLDQIGLELLVTGDSEDNIQAWICKTFQDDKKLDKPIKIFRVDEYLTIKEIQHLLGHIR